MREMNVSGPLFKHRNAQPRSTDQAGSAKVIAKRYSSYLQQFYQRIQRSRGGGRANIALASKFLGVIYYTLKNHWVFEDFPNFVLASWNRPQLQHE
jgi:hypothetical protein